MNIKTQLQKMKISDIKWIANSLNIKFVKKDNKEKIIKNLLLPLTSNKKYKMIDFTINKQQKEVLGVQKRDELVAQQVVRDLYQKGYIFDKFLGKGGIGIVLQFKYKDGLIAVKASYPWQYSKVKNMKSAAIYIENNKHVCGDNFNYILEFKYIGEGSQMYFDNKLEYFSSEIMDDDLFNYSSNYLPRMDNNYHKENIIKYIKCQLIYGIYCIHQMGMIHGDIKFENILIKNFKEGNYPIIKFIDFDGYGTYDKDTSKNIIDISVFTRRYVMYDIYSLKEYTIKDDIFALGIVILGLYNINASYSIQDLLIHLRRGRRVFGFRDWDSYIDRKFKTWGKNIPKIMRDTLKKMLSYNRYDRPNAKELYENREIFDCDNIMEDVKNQDLADFAYV